MKWAVVVLALAAPARAERLTGLAAGPSDDARLAVAIGPAGEVYDPDGKGAWTRTQRFALATPVAAVERGATGVIASGGGAVYRLAANGWTAARLGQKAGKSLAGTGTRALAALGKDLFDLDRAGGEPVKVATAPAAILAIGGDAIITERGVLRLDHGKLVPIRDAPRLRPISGRWGLTERGAFDLRANKAIPWPSGVAIAVASATAGDVLVAVSAAGELVTVTGEKVARAPIPLDHPGVPVGVIGDRAGRVAIAFQDGRIAVRDRDAWTVATVEERLPPPHPGAPPATSP